MKLKTILLGYGALSVGSLLILGGIGYWAVNQLDNSTNNLATSSKTLRASMQADMMHDALRADAFAVILADETADSAGLKAAETDIQEHTRIFLDNIELVKQLDTSPEVEDALKTTLPKIDDYISSVKSLGQLASDNLNTKQAKSSNQEKSSKQVQLNAVSSHLPKVLTTFSELEEEMAILGDYIEKQNVTTRNDAASTTTKVRNTLIICCILAALLLFSVALAVIRAITKPLGEALKVAETVAAGDLTAEINISSNNEVSQLLKSLKLMQQNLHKLVMQIKESADSISNGTQEISAGNTNLSQRTEEQASSLEETASSMEQMASTVKLNAENAKQANMMANEASAVAIKGGNAVSQVVNTMSDINTSSKKIVEIISVIDGIAFQTNILALNAAVEAARAGEQGRGFAVVAAEVRNLAQRSASAAKEIKQLIGDSVEKVSVGTKQVQAAGETMDEIVLAVKMVSDIVNEITAASMEQSAGIDQVNNAITNMDEVVQQNAALVEQAAAAANSLESKAHELTEATGAFRLAEESHREIKKDLGQQALNEVSAPQTRKLPKNKQNHIKAPKVKVDEDWEEF
jgi:methyl-accepting chemotaxis protein